MFEFISLFCGETRSGLLSSCCWEMPWTQLREIALLILFMMNSGRSSPKCQQSEYLVNERCCPLCPAGERVEHDCTRAQKYKRNCTNCTEGTYMDHPTGRRKCFPCTNCTVSGLIVKMSCTTTSDTVCSNCTEGTFSNGSCQPHTKYESVYPTPIKAGNVSTVAEHRENLSKWKTIIGSVVSIIFLVFLVILVYHIIRKKCCRRETGTDVELRTLSNVRSP